MPQVQHSDLLPRHGIAEFKPAAVQRVTPVVAYATGNLPALLDGTRAGVPIPAAAGPRSLWQAARDLLADPARYRQACGAAYCRSRNYRSADIGDTFRRQRA